MPKMKNKALAYHRGRWKWIDNPLDEEESLDIIDRRRSVQIYSRKWWKLGPAYAYPNYTGILISTYAYVGNRNLPDFLIWIHAVGMSVRFYALDLPDLMEVLSMLAPIVFTGILADAHHRTR